MYIAIAKYVDQTENFTKVDTYLEAEDFIAEEETRNLESLLYTEILKDGKSVYFFRVNYGSNFD